MKPIELTLRLKNNCLKERRLALGLSMRALAEKAGISYQRYSELEGLKRSPLIKQNNDRYAQNYTWSRTAERLSMFLAAPCEDLFPGVVLAVKDPTAIRKLSEKQCLALVGAYSRKLLESGNPEEQVILAERENFTHKLLNNLSAQEERIIRCRFGIGERFLKEPDIENYSPKLCRNCAYYEAFFEQESRSGTCTKLDLVMVNVGLCNEYSKR